MSVAQVVEKMRDFYANDLPTRIAFQTHPLRGANDYVKGVYCTMLAVILQYENEPMREQTIFLERITAGVGLEISVQQLMQKAQLVDEKFAKDFYDELIASAYAENFAVDALIMLNCTIKVNEKQIELLTEVLDVLAISEAQLKELLQFTKVFLAMDAEGFNQVFGRSASLNYLQQFDHYIAELNGNGNNAKKFITEHVAIYVNMNITPELLGGDVHNKSLVIFKECQFLNLQQSIVVRNVGGLILDECYVKNFDKRVFDCSNVQDIFIYKTIVQDVNYSGNDNIYGAFLYLNSCSNLYIYQSEFNNVTVYASHSTPYSDGAIACGPIGRLAIHNSNFIKCRSNARYYGGALIINKEKNASNENERLKLAGEPTFTDFLEREYGIEVQLDVVNNQITDCQPSHLYHAR